MFLQVSVILSTGGACVVAPGGGHVWLFWGVCGCSWGGMHGCSGGHAWLLLGGMHGCSRGHVWLLWGGHVWLLQGVCVWLIWGVCIVAVGGMHGCSGGACMVALGGVWLLLGGGVHGCSRGCALDTTRYGDTINERAVHILLECILVMEMFLKRA